MQALSTVNLDSKSPLIDIKVMVRAGSAQDPEGLEGLAALTGNLLIQGSFGDPDNPVTKDKLAEITRPWGSGAYPSVSVTKEITVFSFTVPREKIGPYIERVLKPLFNQPRFDPAELQRVRGETLEALRSGLRLEEIETLGLVSLDNDIHDGTAYAHPDFGTEKGLEAVKRDSLLSFYKTYYTPANMVVGVSASDKNATAKLEAALAAVGSRVEAPALAPRENAAPAAVSGRQALIVALPSAISTGLHAGFPLPITRKDKDYWALYVANTWFGAHRDSFSYLYQVIREQRGYNYGDYSYIEHFEGRPENLFPPFNAPRRYQYFSIWARTVAHAYAPHIVKAFTWELENFIRSGLSEEDCALSKNKAKVLYLSLADTTERMLASRLDDRFYGLEPGYLPSYLKNIDAVSCGEINAAIKKHLQAKDLKYLVVTQADEAPKIAEALVTTAPVWGKAPSDYHIDVKQEDGKDLYLVAEPKLAILQKDAVWAYAPLGIPKESIRVVPVEKMFETAALPK